MKNIADSSLAKRSREYSARYSVRVPGERVYASFHGRKLFRRGFAGRRINSIIAAVRNNTASTGGETRLP